MPQISHFTELSCWQTARVLSKSCYTLDGPIKRDFGMRDQWTRASVSVMNNIAEGFTRFSHKEKIRFFEYAQSSASEVESMCYLMHDLGYINDAQFEYFLELADKSRKQVLSFIHYLKGCGR